MWLSDLSQIGVEETVHVAAIQEIRSSGIDLVNHEVIEFFWIHIINDVQEQLLFKLELECLWQIERFGGLMRQVDDAQFEALALALRLISSLLHKWADVVHVLLYSFVNIEFPGRSLV